VITLELARRLREAGVTWKPARGDRFAIPDRDMDEAVFVVSDMVVEIQELPSGPLVKFNGTTEWALDSIQPRETVWLPREEQLRELLGEAFDSLSATPDGLRVTTRYDGTKRRHVHPDAECALAEALLTRLAARAGRSHLRPVVGRG
jgi:hypothetical protein